MADRPLYLEDLTVGQVLRSGSHRMEADEIKDFARRYDPQPFHLDEEAARDSLFGGLAASGFHTAATMMRLLVEGGLPLAGGVIGTGGELTWPRPTRPGDTLRVESEILEITPSRSRPGLGTALVRCTMRNQDGEVVQTFTPRVTLQRRPDRPG